MFFSASIAFTFLLSLSAAVNGAPLSKKAVVPQVCTGSKGSGVCTPLNVSEGNPSACTNVVGEVKSLILNPDDVCVSTQNLDCTIVAPDGGISVAVEHFSDDKDDLEPGVRSISCSRFEGLVNGLFPQ
ncbi:hypothetical protein C8J57DRAFT_1217752 [Mycena rebaudengoi]|nr:hypothetical protein C8J57DRAFT_1217752 [Mycena rebaudengoi]